jgi:SAM-dependent methyltransferase
MTIRIDPSQARDQATLDFYSQEAPVYTASGKNGVSRWLDDFMSALPPEAHVLELGCGGGRDAQAMMQHGLRVEATDGVAAMAAKAEKRLGIRVRVMAFDELAARELYDGVWANASLLHVPRLSLPGVLALVFNALKPGGIHFASYKGGGVAGRDKLGRYFNYLDRAALLHAYRRSAAWDVLSVTEFASGGYDGAQGPWIAVTARRPDGVATAHVTA